MRLPPKLASRISARLARQERSKGDAAMLRRRRKNQHLGGKSRKEVVQSMVEDIWEEGGPPDYDSEEEAGDLLDLDQDEENPNENADKRDENKMDVEEDDEEEEEELLVDYWRLQGTDYVFRYGEEEYHATMVTLPCVVEVQKTLDSVSLYKTGDLSQMLVVHDVKKTATSVKPDVQSDVLDGFYKHGLTTPMHGVMERFIRIAFKVHLLCS